MITVALPFPPTVNTYWRHITSRGKTRTILSRAGRQYKHDVFMAVGSSRHMPAVQQMRSQRIAVTIYVSPPDKRRRDLDNLLKAPLDALTGILWDDDGQIDDLRIVRKQPLGTGNILVHAEPID